MNMYFARLKENLFNRVIKIRRKIRRFLSRSEWILRVFSWQRDKTVDRKSGLILIQIDGLSRRQFEQALQAGRMPFLNQLRQEGHQLVSFYSGMPSTTPAVQGELFYGVRSAVPAFSFRDRTSGRIISMLNSASASDVEHSLLQHGEEPLLQGGSAYCDMYRGGAKKASFCSSSPGVDTTLRRANPWAVFLALLLHGAIVLRVMALFVIECVLALIDLFRGVVEGKKFIKELSFIPYRLIVCILLRELTSAGLVLDIALGLPIVHGNFLGYDEQSHRRGPSSAFAHWTLKGIDGCLKRIWRFAQTTAQRDYDIWIYSDHGQEAAQPYETAEGRTLETAITEQLQQLNMQTSELSATVDSIQLKRVGWLGGTLVQRLLKREASSPDRRLEVTANGPVGHLYLPSTLSFESRKTLGKALADEVHVPVVMMRDEDESILFWTRGHGQGRFPDDAAVVLGEEHPFFEDLCRDIPTLMRHPDSGMFVLFGWGAGRQPVNFGIENGGHAGFGPEETRGFALLSQDAPLPEGTERVRPSELREAALRFLGRRPELPASEAPEPSSRAGHETLRVMTYNIHSCVGMDGKVSPQRIARVLAQYKPDIAVLQEVDVKRPRTGGADQAQQIAAFLNMEYHFHPSFSIAEERYGNAILSRFPLRVVKTGPLPGKTGLEPRGILWIEILRHDRPIQVLGTHLGLRRRERQEQIDEILGEQWLNHPDCRHPVLFCADLNVRAKSAIYQRLQRVLQDTNSGRSGSQKVPSWMGIATLDYIFASSGWEARRRMVPLNALTRKASDHRPVIVDLLLA